MGKRHLNPAEYVYFVFKGVRATARAVGRSSSAVSRWNAPKAKRGGAGTVPNGVMKTILSIAERRGLDITEKDLIRGRKIKTLK